MPDLKAAVASSSAERNAEKRRSMRVTLALPVHVRGGGNGKPNFQEETSTIQVSAHGCMVRLAAKVERAQDITLINKKTAEALDCKVTFLGQTELGKTEVGVEFTEPSPVFWRIAFPPEDWDPSERKRSRS